MTLQVRNATPFESISLSRSSEQVEASMSSFNTPSALSAIFECLAEVIAKFCGVNYLTFATIAGQRSACE